MLATTDTTTGDTLRAGTGTPSVLGKHSRSHPIEADLPNQAVVSVTNLCGMPTNVSLLVGDNLDMVAAGREYTRDNHTLFNLENNKEYCPFLGEFYTVATTNPAFCVTVLIAPVAEAIKALRLLTTPEPPYIPWKTFVAVNTLICTDLLKHDYHVALTAVMKVDGLTLQYFADTVNENPVVVLAAVKTNLSRYASPFKYASDALRCNREMVMEVLRLYDGHATNFLNAWRHVSRKLMSDRELVLAAVRIDGDALEQASEELQDDREVVIAAGACGLRHASLAMRGDEGVVMAAVAEDGTALQYASEELQGRFGVVLEAVTENGLALEDASPTMRENLELCLAAVTNNGAALEFCADIPKDTPEIVIAAVKSDDDALRFGSPQMQNTPAVVNATIEAYDIDLTCSMYWEPGFRHSSPEMRANREVVMRAVTKWGRNLEYVSTAMRGDRAVVMAAVRKAVACDDLSGTWAVLEYASDELRGGESLAMEVVALLAESSQPMAS
jgi:hypothetical protein